jgi:predicted amidophosphoribosyltransferase
MKAYNDEWAYLTGKKDIICRTCENKKRWIHDREIILGCPVRILYAYDEWMKHILYRYKGLGDHALSPYFLSSLHGWLTIRYNHYVWVIAPHYPMQDQRRGFIPLLSIIKGFKSHDIFRKKDDYKQSDQPFFTRKNIQHHLEVNRYELSRIPKNQRLLLIDDVITSKETMTWMIHSLKQLGYDKLQGLVLSRPTKT